MPDETSTVNTGQPEVADTVDNPAVVEDTNTISYSPKTTEFMNTKGWKTPDDIVKSYSELEKFVGNKDSIIKLPSEPDSEDWGNVFNRLGRPESPDKYEFKNDTGIDLEEQSINAFKEVAHKAGLTQSQYETVVKEHINVFKNLTEQAEITKKEEDAKYEAEIKACDDELAKDWGESRTANTVKALEFAKEFDLLNLLEKKKLDSDPEIIKALYRLDGLRGDDKIKNSKEIRKQSRDEELKAIMDNPAFTNNMDVDHKKLHARYLELMGISGKA